MLSDLTELGKQGMVREQMLELPSYRLTLKLQQNGTVYVMRRDGTVGQRLSPMGYKGLDQLLAIKGVLAEPVKKATFFANVKLSCDRQPRAPVTLELKINGMPSLKNLEQLYDTWPTVTVQADRYC